MRAHTLISCATTLALAWMIGATPAARSAQAAASLGTVRIPRAAIANGEPLPAGTYTLRLSGADVTPVVGQKNSEHWIEFVQQGQVKGRELASVVAPADVKEVAEGAPPAPGSARVQMLRGAEYLRVWLNRAGTNYLVHLSLK
jgi:hypothetical protein